MARSPRTEASHQYSLRLVARVTGLSADTLRMWERRYGYPAPKRDPQGNRLYTDRDIDRLQQVKRALQMGFKPAEVVAKPLAELTQVLAHVSETQKEVGPTVSGVEALVFGEAVSGRADARRAAHALGPRAFVVDYASWAAEELGRLWAQGKIEVHQEHLASDLLCTQLRALFASFEEGGSPLVVLATLSGERHVIGLWMAALYLASAGANVRVLGAELPVDQLVRATERLGAEVAALSVSPAADLRAVEQDLQWLLAHLPKGTELWVGGKVSSQLKVRDRRFRAVPTWEDVDRALGRFQGKR